MIWAAAAALGCCRFARVRRTAHSAWQPVRADDAAARALKPAPVLR